MSVATLLMNPDEFFERADSTPSLRYPFGIAIIVGIVGTLASYPLFQVSQQAVSADAEGLSSVTGVVLIAAAFLGVFAIWMILTAVVYAISVVAFDGDGSFKTTLAYVGWGLFPDLFAGIINAAFTFYAFQSVTVPANMSPQQIQGFIESVQSGPVLMTASVIGIIFLLWKGVLWIFAVKHAQQLALREAVITVAIPVGLFLLWQLYNLL